jgi:glycosyltransferase involved in cell wall biosynthesis
MVREPPVVRPARVLIIYRYIPQYRRDFYQLLREDLARRNIELDLVHGDPLGEDSSKGDESHIEWAHWIRNRALGSRTRPLVWQPALPFARKADLVIVEQASKLLVNSVLLAWARAGGPPVAFWGHGANLQSDGSMLSRASEAVKRLQTRSAAWMFAYTEDSRERARSAGLPADRITVVQNAVDTGSLAAEVECITPDQLAYARAQRCLGDGPIALFMGSHYAEKKLDLLVSVADKAHRHIDDFQLIIAGQGPLTNSIRAQVQGMPWVHVVGRASGPEKALLLGLADIMLNPGLVGLAVLDAFAAGVPVITGSNARHSPEIAYVVSGVNGEIVASDDPIIFSQRVVDILADEPHLRQLQDGARRTARTITLPEMVRRFSAGVEEALARSR